MDKNELKQAIFKLIAELLIDKSIIPVDDMPLIGSDTVLDSMKLVELCLALEDTATELGFEFDWTSDSAMSRSRSMFRTAGSLVIEFTSQMELKK
jgi:acyl carrier protein